MDKLLKKDVEFVWSPECERGFKKVKELLWSDLLLAHFNPASNLIVAADASSYGIGAVLLQQ